MLRCPTCKMCFLPIPGFISSTRVTHGDLNSACLDSSVVEHFVHEIVGFRSHLRYSSLHKKSSQVLWVLLLCLFSLPSVLSINNRVSQKTTILFTYCISTYIHRHHHMYLHVHVQCTGTCEQRVSPALARPQPTDTAVTIANYRIYCTQCCYTVIRLITTGV